MIHQGYKQASSTICDLFINPSFLLKNQLICLYFQSILIGVAGFWGGVFCMGFLYLLAVLTKRVFKPEEAEKIAE